jgi:hypothetical protein
MSAGAYGFTMSSNYNSRPRAAEVMVKGREYSVVRARETYEDLVRGEEAGGAAPAGKARKKAPRKAARKTARRSAGKAGAKTKGLATRVAEKVGGKLGTTVGTAKKKRSRGKAKA